MSDINIAPNSDLDTVVSNSFGEHYLYAVNQTAFQNTDAKTVFRNYYGDSLFQEHTFYIVAGTDSGLLYQFINATGVPKGSRYLFVELPEVLERLVEMKDPENVMVTTTLPEWEQCGVSDMNMLDYAIQGSLVLIRSLGVVHAHYDDYLPLWRQLSEDVDKIRTNYRIGLSGQGFAIQQIENLTENQTPAIHLKDLFKGKTAVLLAGGPSLDSMLPWVKQQRNNLVVIAVSRTSASLLRAGITPDILVSVDPTPANLLISKEMYEFQDNALFVNEYHINSSLLACWGGNRVYLGPRYPWSTPLEPENLPHTTGTTVTNMAFAVAMDMGCEQIILGGVDFCYSPTGYSHAIGSIEHKHGTCPVSGNLRVETNSGKMADTRRDLLSSAHCLETKAQEAAEQGCRIINSSPNAVRLTNVEHLALDDIEIPPLPKPAIEIITDALPANDSKNRCLHYKEVLGEIDRVTAELREIKKLCTDALRHNRNIFKPHKKDSAAASEAKLKRIEEKLEQKHTEILRFVKHFGIRRLVFTLKKHEQSEENPTKKELMENNKYYFLSLSDTAKEIIEILQQARTRTLTRLEEEKPTPDVNHLIDYWRSHRQPGRALQWKHRHKDYVEQLQDTQKSALASFQDDFDKLIDEIEEHHLIEIRRDASIDGSSAKARNFFLHRDEAGLLTLLSALKNHEDKELAHKHIPLVEGYLAELHDDIPLAIETYQKTKEGPAQIDSLQRLFALYVQNEDIDSILNVLHTLSGISSAYTPMYAELLNKKGDVEKSVEIFTDYILENPEDLNSVMKLGEIYYQHGAIDGVEWAMNYILSKDPNNQAAKALLKSLDQTQESGG